MAKTPLEEWVNYLKNGVIKSDTKAPGLQEARKKLQYYSMSNAERHAYDEHLNAIMIQNDVLDNAKREGRAEGKAEEKIENAKNFLAMGLSPEQVAEGTKLPLDEVMKLVKD